MRLKLLQSGHAQDTAMDPTHPYSMSTENLNALLDMEVWDLWQWRVVLASDFPTIIFRQCLM